MNIIIKLEEKDTGAVAGFCKATGWNDRLGKPEEWMTRQVSRWVAEKCRQGVVFGATETVRVQYVTASRNANADAKNTVPEPVVTVETAP